MRFIPSKIHGLLDYLVAIVFICLPWMLRFNGPNEATYVPVTLGILTILYSLITNYEWGVRKIIPMGMHLTIDLVAGLILALSPWIFGFVSYIYLPHLLLGILEMAVALTSSRFVTGVLPVVPADRL